MKWNFLASVSVNAYSNVKKYKKKNGTTSNKFQAVMTLFTYGQWTKKTKMKHVQQNSLAVCRYVFIFLWK